MKIVGIISEYNPFHSGHLYQVEEIRKAIPNARIISIMSGNFMQRGEPSFLNKNIRTKLAIDNGVDLIIQLPTLYSLQSAENFALGGVKILKAINCIDYISFGIESDDFADILKIANTQLMENSMLNFLIDKNMNDGKSYSVSYKDATMELLNNNIDENIFLSNNILALEYIKSVKNLNMETNFLPIKRSGNNYLDEIIEDDKFASATSIRKNILSGKIDSTINHIPEISYEEIKKYDDFNSMDEYFNILKYNLLVLNRNMKNITGYEKGINNLFVKNMMKSKDMKEFIDLSISKRYKKGRIQRFIINYLLNIGKGFVDEVVQSPNNYIKVLGFNNNGKEILRNIKRTSEVNIVTKNKDFKPLSDLDRKLYDLESYATNLYNLYNDQYKSEYENSIYYKEDYK